MKERNYNKCENCISRRTKGGVLNCSLGINRSEMNGRCGSFAYGNMMDDYRFVYDGDVDSVTEAWLNGEDV